MFSCASLFKRCDCLVILLLINFILVLEIWHLLPLEADNLPDLQDIVRPIGHQDSTNSTAKDATIPDSVSSLKDNLKDAGNLNSLDLSAGNATLGFQAIIAISSEDRNDAHAWRQDGLIKAANRTGLSIQIPRQRLATFKQLEKLRAPQIKSNGRIDRTSPRPSEGQARAWLAHLNVLERIIETRATTALIIEDDADWDISLRNSTAGISSAVRALTRSISPSNLYPYGLNWDILWLGHCGDMYPAPAPPSIQISDTAVLLTPLLRTVWFGSDYAAFANRTRNVHFAGGPMCSFGYAVTLRGASKLKLWASNTGEAFDVKMHEGCRDGKLRCLTVSPEVIHHQRMEGTEALSSTQFVPDNYRAKWQEEIGEYAGLGNLKHGKASGDGRVTMDGKRVFTHNVMHSARCNWNRADNDLVQCLPNAEEWERFQT